MADIHARYRNNPVIQDADLCALHDNDADLAVALRVEERRLLLTRTAE